MLVDAAVAHPGQLRIRDQLDLVHRTHPDPAQGRRYAHEMTPDSVPELIERFGVLMPGMPLD